MYETMVLPLLSLVNICCFFICYLRVDHKRNQASIRYHKLNTSKPRQNGRHFAGDTFKRIFLNENVRISIKILLKFVPRGPIDNIPPLVQIVAWRQPGDKPLSE